MAAANRSSLSAATQGKGSTKPANISDYDSVKEPSRLIYSKNRKLHDIKSLTIKVNDDPDGAVPGFLHIPASRPSKPDFAAILLSGAGGGVVGPSSIYMSIAEKLSSLDTGIPVMRLDYRYPARNKYCTRDVLAAMDYIESNYSISKFVLVGWSFGGAPVFAVGGMDSRVIACATVASQTAETEGIRNLAPRPVLLLHGKADRTLSPSCSRNLYELYGPRGDRRIHIFDGDDHSLTRHAAKAEEMLCDFIAEVGGLKISETDQEDVVRKELVDDGERVELMKKGGDLRGEERVE
ncbi:alpha/beta-Hydrolase [Glarea lozoyensis ATCC 20868]|uniref:Alpha/beta-Hydrolase n=1 Tax=Glarea lozoyensis (strain ATCC 20868 / MF5171) TaxID=1116229 RepID=S3DQH4_GLAL2|nr:alpha/beta-Hydrolase [Glarea lozoyensis ATCC 20868]EPE28728.1 alpha/beta-Hydrolase [Glarea lozoyensis ATCC 20868]